MNHALCALLLCSVLSSACKTAPKNVESFDAKVKHKDGRHTEISFVEGQETYSLNGEGGGLTVSIEKVRNDYKGRKVVVHFALRNNFGRELRFDLNDARMVYAGQEYAAKGSALWGDLQPNVPPKTSKKYGWAFELDALAEPGTYDVFVRGLRFFEAGATTPLGQDLLFQVKVPGERAPE